MVPKIIIPIDYETVNANSFHGIGHRDRDVYWSFIEPKQNQDNFYCKKSTLTFALAFCPTTMKHERFGDNMYWYEGASIAHNLIHALCAAKGGMKFMPNAPGVYDYVLNMTSNISE